VAAAEQVVEPRQAENVTDLLQVDPMELEIGYGLIPLVDTAQGGSLLNRISLIRRQVAVELGIVLPTIRIRDNLQLPPNSYAIKLRGVQIASGESQVGHYLAMNPGTAEAGMDGMPTTEPVFGLPALWIQGPQKERAELQGYTVVDAASVITTHLTEVIRSHAPQILTRQDVQALLDGLKQTAPVVVEDLVPSVLTLGEVHRVLQALLAERVPIRDLTTVLETLADRGRTTRDLEVLTEHARHALGRTICDQYREAENALWVITVAPQLEHNLSQSLHQTDQGTVLALDPQLTQRVLEQFATQMENTAAEGHQPIALVSSRIRQPLRRLVQRRLPNLVVLSYSEITPEIRVHAQGTVTLEPDA
jgi:flagellar biosynthesis protein FlhA